MAIDTVVDITAHDREILFSLLTQYLPENFKTTIKASQAVMDANGG